MFRYTPLYLKWITDQDQLYSPGNSVQCYVGTWMGRRLGEKGYMCVYGQVPSLSPWNYHSNCQLAILQYKIKSLMNKNEIKCVSMLGLSHMSRLKLGIEIFLFRMAWITSLRPQPYLYLSANKTEVWEDSSLFPRRKPTVLHYQYICVNFQRLWREEIPSVEESILMLLAMHLCNILPMW